ncbi:hypothetical protein [Kineosporia babensis]|uniref:HEAT repeat domain-containing protein n=1 Tax=Kineosporia babensis TaxID=499548 RepID=A0A9X1SRT0_9ACTN|nr:hypothetical protein [Kineosporia babensis]MCD5309506.1 hypothetical protein [Kineosporia babensis]
MADFVHLTPERNAARVVRSGIAARSRRLNGERGVYCMPVLPSFVQTHQWARELRRWQPGPLAAVQFRLPDHTPVTVGRYTAEPQHLSAAQAAALLRGMPDSSGQEVFVLRAVTAQEVRHVRAIPQGIGWRYLPGAHGTAPCACPVCLQPGTPGAARIRRRFSRDDRRPTKPELMRQLRDATTDDEIILALMALGTRSRGDSHELAYLADHPDPDVREVLADALAAYRGRPARELRTRILAGLPPADAS